MQKSTKILVCPLDWGLGHASRDIPIICKLLDAGFDVIIAACGDTVNFLKLEFPELVVINLPGYKIRYSKRNFQIIKMLALIPKIISHTYKEHYLLKEIIEKYAIDIVIADNRFGLWNNRTYNIFITHQLKVKFPGFLRLLEPIYKGISGFFIRRFDECWIPDYMSENNLSGELSHSKIKLDNCYYIGPLSRFMKDAKNEVNEDIDILFVLSGPEPQRSIFENKIIDQVNDKGLKIILVRGTTKKINKMPKIVVLDVANTKILSDLLVRAKMVICRSGYTSIMDLYLLKKKTVLVPTPGQTEQEYLAQYLSQKNIFYSITQKEFTLDMATQNVFNFPEISKEKNEVLEQRIINLKKKYCSS
ncbi:MAG: glycosyltransferase [Marinilabiliales bacterium]|nr:MAG: glycosyltransferase [Marinilabiliales bacterium]